MSATITVRVPRELKEAIKKYRIRVSDVVRRALEEEVRRRREQEVEEALDRLGEALSKVPPEEIVRAVREDRGR